MSDQIDHPFFDEPPPEPERSGLPPWLLPAAVGAVVTLLLVGLVLVLTRSDEEETADSVPSSLAPTTVPATEPPATEPPATDPPATEPPATEPPATEPPATEPPATEPPATDPPATEPPATEPPATEPPATDPPATDPPGNNVADPVASLAVGEVSIADGESVERFQMLPLCGSTRFVGFQVQSAVLLGDQGTVATLDYELDEGAPAGLVISELNGDIEAFMFGRDGADTGPLQWATEAEPFQPLDRIELQSIGLNQRVDGTPVGAISVSVNPSETGDCATGFVRTPTPFAPGEQVTALGQFDIDDGQATGFAVLAECTNGGRIISGAGLLSFIVNDDGLVLPDIAFTGADASTFLTSRPEPAPTDSFVDQQGGGGDVTYAANVQAADGSTTGYVTWTDRPTVPGGLTPDVCTGF